MKAFLERLYDSYGQQFSIDKIYIQKKTDHHQDLLIFHHAIFGSVMILDGVVQTTECDEFIYHEMLVHLPLFSHPNPKRVLIIGGGDGGTLREVLKHNNLEQVLQVEIDQQVLEMCKIYLPNHSQNSFDDPRATINIDDGFQFIQTCSEKFDVIISDSTDPIGPGKSLFNHDYYAACERCLTDDGVLVTQNGVPFHQMDEVKKTARLFCKIFKDWHFYNAAVPTYIGGMMLFGFATNNTTLRKTSLSILQKRFHEANIRTQYYNSDIHQASWALPEYILKAIGKK